MPVSLPAFDFSALPALPLAVRSRLPGCLVVRMATASPLGVSDRIVPADSVGFMMSPGPVRPNGRRETPLVWFPWVSIDCHGAVPLASVAPIARVGR